jgi:predicted nuclease of predicted toxin-antitoxin system
MKFLVDNALSPAISARLAEAGHDAIHVRDVGMHASADDEVFDLAENEGRVIVSSDTDFGALLAVRRKRTPSFILFRRSQGRRPKEFVSQVLYLVERYTEQLRLGCILTVGDTSVRLRLLPVDLVNDKQ